MELNQKQLLRAFAAVAFFLPAGIAAQTIPNGGFENWNAASFETPTNYNGSSNYDAIRKALPFNAGKVADPQQGSFAVQLQTVANSSDTMFGYFINGDPTSGAGGIPYSEHPVALTGFYKSNIPAGDTALILVFFKQGGTLVSMDFGKFTGVNSTYTPFTMTLSIPISANPDSVIIGAASSNAFTWQGIPGSMFQLDNISFTGVTSQPALLNGSFESWDPHTIYLPAQWAVDGDTIFRTTDAHSGTYALELKTYLSEDNFVNSEMATNGTMPPNSGPVGGQPYSQMNDTLYGWYKYTPAGTDNANILINLTQTGTNVGGGNLTLVPAPSYTFFQLPISASVQPDTMLIQFRSSSGNPSFSNVGSTLKVDDIYLQSSPLTSPFSWNALGPVQLSPNPAAGGSCLLEWSTRSAAPVTVTVADISGRIISCDVTAAGEKRFVIDTAVMSKGAYVVTLEQGGSRVSKKLVVE
jgi:hypothetical protein